MTSLPIVEARADNVDDTSFFCMQSKQKTPGYRRKRAWLDKRFGEGLRIHMLGQRSGSRWQGERGLIEYIPGEHAWRGVEAEGYLFIHCLWVVGKSRGKGGATSLLQRCLHDAQTGGYLGVATVTAENGFATGRKFYEAHGFEAVAECEPRLTLMVHRLRKRAKGPGFSAGVQRGPAHYKHGLTIFRSDQCPYIDDATRLIEQTARKRDIGPIKVVELRTAAEVRRRAPTPYGTFGSVLNGQLLSYRYLTEKEFDKAVSRLD